MSNEVVLRCKDDPEANGRTPQTGERRYSLKFPLESGTTLVLHMGSEGYKQFSDFMGRMVIDDAEEPTDGE